MAATLRVALAQFGSGLADVATNLERMRAMLGEAARQGAALACFPELSLSGYLLEPDDYTAALLDTVHEAERTLADDGRRLGVDLVYGAPLDGARGLTNAVVLQRATGERLVYAKTHMDAKERRLFAPGRGFAADPQGLLGLACCYDLAFPEAIRVVALAGARVIVVPMAWEVERGFVMQRVAAARAVENVAHLVCVNQAGAIGDLRFQGASCVVNPFGETVLELGAGEDLAVAELDLDLVARLRDRSDGRTYPLLRDRRPELYGPLTAAHTAESGLET
jgi:predicted amidohydrolase